MNPYFAESSFQRVCDSVQGSHESLPPCPLRPHDSFASRSSTLNQKGAHLLVFVINQRKLRPLTFILAVGILVAPELKFQPGLSYPLYLINHM